MRVVAVRTGLTSGSWTQVLSGLKAGEVVLLPGVGSYLATGDRVAVTLTRVPPPKPFPVKVTGGTPQGTIVASVVGKATGALSGKGRGRVGRARKAGKKAGAMASGGGTAKAGGGAKAAGTATAKTAGGGGKAAGTAKAAAGGGAKAAGGTAGGGGAA